MTAPECQELDVDVLVVDEVAAIDVGGDLDLTTAPRLIAAVRDQVSAPVRRIEVDCRDVEFLDSAGVRAMIVGRNEAERAGIWFGLTNPSRAVKRVLDMTGLTALMQLEPAR
jgi:anti-sigma B factor antagonist